MRYLLAVALAAVIPSLQAFGGNVYFTLDRVAQGSPNSFVGMIDPAGTQTEVASLPANTAPRGLALDGVGNLYFGRITEGTSVLDLMKRDAGGQVTVLASLGNWWGGGNSEFDLAVPEPTKWYGVFVGSNDYKVDGTIKVNGQAAAQGVLDKFSQLIDFSEVTLLPYNVGDLSLSPVTDIKAALDAYTARMRPGDNLILFYAGHGGGSTTDVSLDESLYATLTAGTGQFVDDDLTAWFLDPSRKDKWADVNKMFILDSCFSGGFWGGEDEDLVSLEKVALLAAARELRYAYADPDHDGEPYFSRALQEGLVKDGNWAKADVGGDGLTAEDLKTWLENYPLPEDAVGYIQQLWSDDLVLAEWDVMVLTSQDFDMVVPEPGTLFLIGSGILGLVFGRRVCRPPPVA